MAKLNSEDATSAKGGDLGWLSPGDTVPAFEEAASKLALNQVSAPVRSPFGWHLIEVLGRRKRDVSADRARMQAQLAIRQRKSDEAFRTGCARRATARTSKCGSTTAKGASPTHGRRLGFC
jgi:peptidyl-prolyl cis-trans isomerase SurA